MANVIGKFNTNEVLTGTSEADLIIGSTGPDLLFGLTGNDTIIASIDNDTIDGGDNNDLLFGNAGNDLLDGGTGSDSLKGGAGNDFVFGNDGNDLLFGGAGNDTLNGGTGNDTFIIFGRGNNTIDGGADNDIVDYSELRRAINLKNIDVVDKGRNGTDTLTNIETIIAPILNPNLTSAVNTIDGSGDDTIPSSFIVDLENKTLTVNGLSTGSASFTVENFNDVIGTPNADSIAGNSSNNLIQGGKSDDTLIATAGFDTLIGGDGIDLVDYTFLNNGTGIVVLTNGGIVEKFDMPLVIPGAIPISIGTDNLQTIEVINANPGSAIDGSSTTAIPGSFNVDLATGNLTIEGIDVNGITNPSFTISGFDNVLGTVNDDLIVGNDNNNALSGFDGLDTITGGAGQDNFIFGDGSTVFYSTTGTSDFATIADFATGVDTIGLTPLGGMALTDDYTLDTMTEMGNTLISVTSSGDLIAKVIGANVASTDLLPLVFP